LGTAVPLKKTEKKKIWARSGLKNYIFMPMDSRMAQLTDLWGKKAETRSNILLTLHRMPFFWQNRPGVLSATNIGRKYV
jgi:hypothetical protein